MGDGASGCVRRWVWTSSTRRSRLRSTVRWHSSSRSIQIWIRCSGWGGEEEWGFHTPSNLPDMLMKVSGREAFSPRPLGDDGRKPLLCVISDHSRSPNAAYCHFKVVVHLHTTLVKCPRSCSCSCSPEQSFFFLSFWKVKHPASSRASFFTLEIWVSAQVWGITATTSSQFALS